MPLDRLLLDQAHKTSAKRWFSKLWPMNFQFRPTIIANRHAAREWPSTKGKSEDFISIGSEVAASKLIERDHVSAQAYAEHSFVLVCRIPSSLTASAAQWFGRWHSGQLLELIILNARLALNRNLLANSKPPL